MIAQLGILRERKQQLHRSREDDDEAGRQGRDEQRVVSIEETHKFQLFHSAIGRPQEPCGSSLN